MISSMEPELLNASRMARRLRVEVKWLKSEADAGRIPCIKAGARHLFNSEVVIGVLLQRAGSLDIQQVLAKLLSRGDEIHRRLDELHKEEKALREALKIIRRADVPVQIAEE